jgi:hypothetical protein
MVPTVDNLRNFFLTPTTDMLSFLQLLREVPAERIDVFDDDHQSVVKSRVAI